MFMSHYATVVCKCPQLLRSAQGGRIPYGKTEDRTLERFGERGFVMAVEGLEVKDLALDFQFRPDDCRKEQ